MLFKGWYSMLMLFLSRWYIFTLFEFDMASFWHNDYKGLIAMRIVPHHTLWGTKWFWSIISFLTHICALIHNVSSYCHFTVSFRNLFQWILLYSSYCRQYEANAKPFIKLSNTIIRNHSGLQWGRWVHVVCILSTVSFILSTYVSFLEGLSAYSPMHLDQIALGSSLFMYSEELSKLSIHFFHSDWYKLPFAIFDSWQCNSLLVQKFKR